MTPMPIKGTSEKMNERKTRSSKMTKKTQKQKFNEMIIMEMIIKIIIYFYYGISIMAKKKTLFYHI